MKTSIFNLKDPVEKTVYKRLQEYIYGNDYDYLLGLIGRDFPFMPQGLMAKCEKWLFEYYRTNARGKTIARLLWMTIAHSNHANAPMDSHLTSTFHLNDDEDLHVVFMVENPLYGIGEALVNYTAYLDCNKAGSTRQAMSKDEFRRTFRIPLNIIKNGMLSHEFNREQFAIRLNNSTRHAIHKDQFIEVFYGDNGAKEIFTKRYFSLCNNYNEERCDFYLNEYKSLGLHACLEYNGHYGDIQHLDGIVTIAPSAPSSTLPTVACHVKFHCDDTKKERLLTSCKLVSAENDITNLRRPVYRFMPGKYTVSLYIWGEPICTQEIEFFKEMCEFDRFLEEYIRKENSNQWTE